MKMIYIIEGSLEIENQESFIIQLIFLRCKKTINHGVSSQEECSIMLIESKPQAHWKVKSEITKSIEEQQY
jgi:redox-sensitive bicupin YhaK (pirin superfamily)